MQYLLASLLTLFIFSLPQTETITVGPIDFFGYGTFSPQQLRAALPLHEGDKLSHESKDQTVAEIKRVLTQQTGREPSDVASICCDAQGRLLLYIGFAGQTSHSIVFNVTPHDSHVHLPSSALKAYRASDEAWSAAMEKGNFAEDDSLGYALSADPQARSKQLALHAYAIRHEPVIQRVLAASADAEQRQIAAQMLGYVGVSLSTIKALTRAALDPDEGVRNNALRALGVMARAKPHVAGIITIDNLIGLLSSGIWTDRNKSSLLFGALTEGRNPERLGRLRAQALDSLIEIARWQNAGHADSARLILGRMAGIKEESLVKLIGDNQTEVIIHAVLGNEKSQ